MIFAGICFEPYSKKRKDKKMSLLPIIYTSLILFFGLMMIVIIISYISYKIKAEKNPVIEEEKNKINQLNIPQRIINPNPIVNVYTTRIESNTPVNYQHQYRNNSYSQNYRTKKTTYYKTKNLKPRIEIMNSNPVFRKNESADKFKREINRSNNSNNLDNQNSSNRTYSSDRSNINLLNYYTDNDEKLVELKIMPVAR